MPDMTAADSLDDSIRSLQRRARSYGAFIPLHLRDRLPKKIALGDGVELTIERLNGQGPVGFVVERGLERFAAFDCAWTPEEAEAAALRAIILRFGID